VSGLSSFATSRASIPQPCPTDGSREGAKTRSHAYRPSATATDQSISRHLLDRRVFETAPFRPIALAFCQSNIFLFSFFAPSRLRVRQSLSLARSMALAKARGREAMRTDRRLLRRINRYPGICLTGESSQLPPFDRSYWPSANPISASSPSPRLRDFACVNPSALPDRWLSRRREDAKSCV
jgi:hypothetical protein